MAANERKNRHHQRNVLETPTSSLKRSDLLPLVGMLSPTVKGTPAELNRRFKKTGKEAHGKFATVSILEAVDSEETELFAVKRQPIASPTAASDVSVREWRIFNRLSELATRGLCFNFVMLVESFVERREDNHRYMDLVLEYADSDLKREGKNGLKPREYKEIVFQIIWALLISQREMEFIHNDMHLGNILLQKPSQGTVCQFKKGGDPRNNHSSTWFITNWIVKISDFGNSRIKLKDGTIVYNNADPVCEVFMPNTDVEKLQDDLKSLKLVDGDGDDDGGSWNEKEKKELRSFKSALARNKLALEKLLDHTFFDDLRQIPNDFENRVHLTASFTEERTNYGEEGSDVETLGERIAKIKLEENQAKTNSTANEENKQHNI